MTEPALPARILITGASGFVGRHLQAALRARCPGVTLLTDPFDLRDPGAVKAAVRAAAPAACVHLAGVTAVGRAQADPDLAWQVNLHGTLNLARAVLDDAPACRFLHVSSTEVYGAAFLAGQPVDETAALAPMNTYAATKAAADLAVGALAGEGLRAIRLRPVNHTGPGQHDAFVVPAFARQLARIRAGAQAPVIRVGSLAPIRDFLDVRDVCDAYVACLLCPLDTVGHALPDRVAPGAAACPSSGSVLAPGTVLNIASGTSRRIGDILRDLARLAGVNPVIETEAARWRPVEIPVARVDAGRARAALAWAPRTPWLNTLRDVLAEGG